jgi:hypothetical protein
MIKNKKGALEFSFTWVFAIIAGMFILFLAIYGVSKFMNIEKSSQNAQTATDIGVLTNPLGSSFETGKRTLISTSVQTRIYPGCSSNGFFGRQTLKTSQKVYNQWSDAGVNVGFSNKYIFSENPVEGKNFYLFSKPFEFPFKVADLIYLTSTNDKYCFKDAPENIKTEIDDLTGNNLSVNENFFTKDSGCPPGSINVCFKGGSNCNITVNTVLNYVEKDGKQMYYEGDALMYAAIFSDKDNYECQLDRLMKRTEQLAIIYNQKSNLIFQRTGCSSDLNADLVQLGNIAGNFGSSESINTVYSLAEDIGSKNEYGECRLW